MEQGQTKINVDESDLARLDSQYITYGGMFFSGPDLEVSDRWREQLEEWFIDIPYQDDLDYRSLVQAAELVHAQTSGLITQRAFLLSRYPQLQYKTALEMLLVDDGPARVWKLAQELSI